MYALWENFKCSVQATMKVAHAQLMKAMQHPGVKQAFEASKSTGSYYLGSGISDKVTELLQTRDGTTSFSAHALSLVEADIMKLGETMMRMPVFSNFQQALAHATKLNHNHQLLSKLLKVPGLSAESVMLGKQLIFWNKGFNKLVQQKHFSDSAHLQKINLFGNKAAGAVSDSLAGLRMLKFVQQKQAELKHDMLKGNKPVACSSAVPEVMLWRAKWASTSYQDIDVDLDNL